MLLHAYLILSGLVDRRYPVGLFVEDVSYDLRLTGRAFIALADLVHAKLGFPESGRTTVPSIRGSASVAVAIHDLRREIDRATGVRGIGHVLVESCHHGEYRLRISVEDTVVAPAFQQLAPRHLSERVVSGIVHYVGEIQMQATS